MSEYNGYTNKETWCVNLWMSEGSTELYEEMATGYLKEEGDEKLAIRELAEWFKREIWESYPDGITGMMDDLLKSALNRVNWREIATNYIESAVEAVEQEKESA
jgi:hypothetical protein